MGAIEKPTEVGNASQSPHQQQCLQIKTDLEYTCWQLCKSWINALFCCHGKGAWQKKQLKSSETALGNGQYEMLFALLPRLTYCTHANCNVKLSYFDRENNTENTMRRQESYYFNIMCSTQILLFMSL